MKNSSNGVIMVIEGCRNFNALHVKWSSFEIGCTLYNFTKFSGLL